jgi:chromatin segregation and condensation protein Rec8/ScpA/Scc1 (kleisin family)
MIEQLAKRIQSNLKVSFREFSKKDRAERMEVIVGFLAMLELVKQGMIAVVQEDRFSDIIMSNDRIDIPRYV